MRVRGVAYVALAALALAGARPAWSQARALDFGQAVELALHQNPDLGAVQAQVAQARAGVEQARGALLPRLSSSLGATRTDDALNAFGLKLAQRGATFNDFGAGQFNPALPGVLGVAPTNLNYPAPVNDFSSRLEAQLPLYTGGKLQGYLRQAHAMLSAAQAGDRAARQQIIDQVLQAYDGVWTARAYEQVAAKALQAAQSQLRMVDNLYRQGVVLKSDLLAARVNLENVRIQQQQAADLEAQAMDGLHVVLGLPLDQPIELAAPVRVPMPEGSTASWIATAQADNPRLAALGQQVAAAGAGVDVARADLYPQVGAMARFETHDPNPGFSAHSYTVGVQLSWNLFDGGVTRQAVDQAAAAREALQLKLRSAREQLGMQVQDAARKASLASSQISGRELAVSQAEEAERIVEQRYANGVGTLLELQGAQAMLDKARADLVLARSQETTQRAALLLALGRLDPGSLPIR
ncbi:TolC family protein [Thiomonas sp.]|uniref:TolC family protein n=1 Tax=Thiomonas sp. TaxID=2047785 RepID=UPI0026035641|nr:TolC family protein [Thiomonas sp.]